MRTIAGADKIILLKEGRISEVGNHEELIALKGDYHRMIELQNKSLNWVLN